MYARNIDGEIYDFGVSGKLIMNVLVMYDRQTESYWSQLLGEAVEGELVGTRLEFFQSWFTTWAEWKERYPETVALDKGGGYQSDTYDRYYASDETGIIDETISDDRLPSKTFIIGVADDEGNAIAYPFSELRQQSLVNDTLGDRGVLVIFIPDAATGLAYDRQVEGQTLTFTYNSDGGTMIDNETGTIWDAWQGIAVEGELEGQILRRIHSTRSFWFGWKDWYPETAIFEAN